MATSSAPVNGNVRMSDLVQIGDSDRLNENDVFLVSQLLSSGKYASRIIPYSRMNRELWKIIKAKICAEDFTGTEKINGNWVFDKTIQGTAMKAYWGDLAENYIADADYEPGTLVRFGGNKEITIADDGKVNAVITSNPGFTLNSSIEGQNIASIALIGRVPVKILGPVRKFDKVYLSENPGIGICSPRGKAIGIALEDSNAADIALVLCSVKMDF